MVRRSIQWFILRLWLVLLSLFLFSPAYATLTLKVTQGVDRPIPVAIADFSNLENSHLNIQGLSAGVAGLIRQNLQTSGLFSVLERTKMPSLYVNPAAVNISTWKKTGAESLLVGQVQLTEAGRYNVSFRLLSVFGQLTSQQIIGERYKNIRPGQMRMLANHISDLIYHALTGKQGVFATRIAYVQLDRERTAYQLLVADADGYNPRTLLKQSQPIMAPTWSPNGQYLAYVSFEDKTMSIWISDLVSGKRRKISSVDGINSAPAWSPDGSRLALALSKAGSAETNIYVINLNTGKRKQITRGYAINTSPAWSPDAKSLIFTSNRGGSPQIYQYDFSTRQVVRLTYQGNYNADARFLPNGQGVVMMHQVIADGQTRFNIAYLNLATGEFRVLTHGYNDESPTVAPNGQMILYTKDRGGNTMLAEVSLDGRVHLNLPSGNGYVRAPAWGPFSS
ncbi:translocation protein TolB [Piscirickettsia salmonis]|uniref:Tol-Pal system beta propeller repeat protein TolB n=1 Tax=Piscirickettsia salmonis TaxID=1238 RepID=UPI0012B83EE8|nr:Tol-Pal system beta propeller repeat protein TolB [Piscirickettsia salmonis]QGP49717.1 translocation protein TolB [Piscirickettsia salmonis]QGP55257.1 translocation protein TolB [Piscirickettsia salmonis]QGP58886.1 translocation protein TolB [Piscirickettsia salmonis]QGP64823.1 translocation protein TolB [Piscirickettsia salmonis]